MIQPAHPRARRTDINADRCKRRQVEALERMEVFGRSLDRAVPSEEVVVEEEADFGDDKVAGENEGAEEVVDCVGEELAERDLRAGEDDGLSAQG